VKHRIGIYVVLFSRFGFLPVAANSAAQSIAYRQTNLASNVPNVAKNIAPGLVNNWGGAFLSGQPFFTANNKDGRITSLDATGLSVSPGEFVVPNPARTGFDSPTGIVADRS